MAKTTDAVSILRNRFAATPEDAKLLAEEKLNVYVARMIRNARTEAGLSQADLAELVGTKQPAINRLENADYEGHSLSMLQAIAEALGKKLTVAFVDEVA
ncbi:MAG: helix-turn-helix transcriptional regulator [Pirellulales bacterium]|nr:helix-turn-helix transcriptional regulator [Pirellulales bacterium]